MSPYYASPTGDVTLYCGDAAAVLRALPAGSVHTCITSVPYYALRSYNTEPQVWGGDAECPHEWGAVGVLDPRGAQIGKAATVDARGAGRGDWCAKCGAWRGELGLEPTPALYVEHIVAVFREVRRVLRDDGCLWLNCGDGYGNERSWGGKSGVKNAGSDAGGYPRHKVGPGLGNKQLLMMPSRVAIALQADGWLLRSMIPYLKRSAMPESVTSRPTTATEYVFLLSKAANYYYDQDAVRIGGREWAGQAGTFARSNGKATTLDAPGQAHASHRAGREDRVPAGRNRRNADWWFDSLRAILDGATGLLADEDGAPLALPVNPQPFPGSHFAVFPERLVEPMLLASTSAKGACPACLAPYVRTTERTEMPADSHKGSYFDRGKTGVNGNGRVQSGERFEKVATGWRAGCACADAGDPVPAVCLDPFAGSGTVGVVARKHGRHFVGIDLSAAYLDMARERLGQLALPLTGWG